MVVDLDRVVLDELLELLDGVAREAVVPEEEVTDGDVEVALALQ